MEPTTLTRMDQLDMSLVTSLEGLLRFVALLDLVDDESLHAADNLLKHWADCAETSAEYEFFNAARQLVRNAREENYHE